MVETTAFTTRKAVYYTVGTRVSTCAQHLNDYLRLKSWRPEFLSSCLDSPQTLNLFLNA